MEATINAVLTLIVGFSPLTHIGRGYENSGKAHDERNKRVLRGYPLLGENYRLPLWYISLMLGLWGAVEASQARLAG